MISDASLTASLAAMSHPHIMPNPAKVDANRPSLWLTLSLRSWRRSPELLFALVGRLKRPETVAGKAPYQDQPGSDDLTE
jgi:hypothetical protein